MHKSLSLALLIAGCGSAEPNESLEDACLKSKCADASILNDSGVDASINTSFPQLPFSGNIIGTIEAGNEIHTVSFNAKNYTVEQFVDGEGNQFSSSEARALHRLSRPVLSPSKETLAFINDYQGEPHLWTYNLRTSELNPIFKAYDGSQISWKDEDSLFISRPGSSQGGLLTMGLFLIDVHSQEAQEKINLPVEPPFFPMGISYEPELDILYFTCPPQHALPTTREEQNDSSDVVYQIPREICLIYANQPTSQYEQITKLGDENLVMSSEILIPRSFHHRDHGVYFACRQENETGICSASFENEGKMALSLSSPSSIGIFDPMEQWLVMGDNKVINTENGEVITLKIMYQGSSINQFLPIGWQGK